MSTFSIRLLSFSSISDLPKSQPTPLFGCSTYDGSLQPHASTKITLLYSPPVLTAHPSIGYFTVKTTGGLGSSLIKCVGQSKGEPHHAQLVSGDMILYMLMLYFYHYYIKRISWVHGKFTQLVVKSCTCTCM